MLKPFTGFMTFVMIFTNVRFHSLLSDAHIAAAVASAVVNSLSPTCTVLRNWQWRHYCWKTRLKTLFSDPALLECADNPDGDSKPQAELEGEGSTSEMVENTATMSSRKITSLNKTEKGKFVDGLRAISGV